MDLKNRLYLNLKRRLDRLQKDAVTRAIDLLEEKGKCLIVMTTGTGKTMTGSKIIDSYEDTFKVLWLTQTEELILQTEGDLKAHFGENAVGLYKRSVRTIDSRITVASLQTLEKEANLNQISRKHFDLLIVDEAHHASASSWERVIRHFHCRKLGLTATPHRSDGKDIAEFFGEAAFTLSYEEAKALKLIASETYRVILTNSQVEGLVTRSGNYKPSALDRLVISEDRNETIVESYKKYGRAFMREHSLPKKAICFCITVAHALRMRDLFLKHSISAEVLVSKHAASLYEQQSPLTEKERGEVYQSFLDGSGPEILCVVNVLNEGKNIRDVGVLLMARPTRSAIIFQQQMGRGCRRIEGQKEQFLVLDYVDLMNRDYPPMSFSRLIGKPIEKEQIMTEYYRGKDPVVIDEYVHYLSTAQSFYPEPKWNKTKATKALREFHTKHGVIRSADLVTHRTGVPNRTTIRRYWKSVKACFEDLGFSVKEQRGWTKETAAAALLQFFQVKKDVLITDLGTRNRLPSKKIIEKFWGNWKACTKALHFDEKKWDEEKVKTAIRNFRKIHGRAPKKRELTLAYGLPGVKIIQKTFGSLGKAIQAA